MTAQLGGRLRVVGVLPQAEAAEFGDVPHGALLGESVQPVTIGRQPRDELEPRSPISSVVWRPN
jgi:hypothetical protein